jgi:hypothetical protein
VTLDGLRHLNVFVGRNNAGKSSVATVLETLRDLWFGEGLNWEKVLTEPNSADRRLGISLTFAVSEAARLALIGRLALGGREASVANSPFASNMSYQFRSAPGRPDLLHLREIRLTAEDGEWAIVRGFPNPSEETSVDPVGITVTLSNARGYSGILSASALSAETNSPLGRQDQRPGLNLGSSLSGFSAGTPEGWLYEQLSEFFRTTFFFGPFRHSLAQSAVNSSPTLAKDGTNLTQVLHTLLADDQRRYRQVQDFVHGALPDVGDLQSPLVNGNQTQIGFRPIADVLLRLRDMGGGIEQLLMVATVLVTRGPGVTVFIDEPESHLHPGAQRYLLQGLLVGARQIFLATHSSLFLAGVHEPQIFRFSITSGVTHAAPTRTSDELAAVLGELGARNADVLLSDGVLFTEGDGDRAAIQAIDGLLGGELLHRNVNIVGIGGSRHGIAAARVTGELLARFSAAAPVPHMFLLDRDERSTSEIDKLIREFGGRVRFLAARELENHFLIPRALLEALREKYRFDSTISSRLSSTTESEISEVIEDSAASLFGTVLLKRVSADLAGLPGGFLGPADVLALAGSASADDLATLIRERIKTRVGSAVDALQIDKIVADQQIELAREWSDKQRRREIAPGAEIVDAVFRHVGGHYAKPQDTERIAQALKSDEVVPDLRSLLDAAASLVVR